MERTMRRAAMAVRVRLIRAARTKRILSTGVSMALLRREDRRGMVAECACRSSVSQRPRHPYDERCYARLGTRDPEPVPRCARDDIEGCRPALPAPGTAVTGQAAKACSGISTGAGRGWVER